MGNYSYPEFSSRTKRKKRHVAVSNDIYNAIEINYRAVGRSVFVILTHNREKKIYKVACRK